MRALIVLCAFLPALLWANPLVRLDTSQGPVVIELFEDQAPQTVANFLQYADRGDYDGTLSPGDSRLHDSGRWL